MSAFGDYVVKLLELERSGRPFVAVTLVEAIGSTPQNIGAKMLVDPSGLVFGTIGGGRVELRALEIATEMLNEPSPRPRLLDWNLQRDIGMTCGGTVKLFFDPCAVAPWRIVLFGAGHVAQALVRTLIPLECQVVCIDSRSEWLAKLPTSPHVEARLVADPTEEVERLRDHDFVLCMTMGHRTDRPILERIFRQRRVFPFLGVIGSAAKRKVLVRELLEADVPAELAEQFVCPMGLPLGNNQPAEIALSIAAQLVQVRDQFQTACDQTTRGRTPPALQS